MVRQRVPIPFGGGLDRHTGAMVTDPSSQEDVRGVHLAEGWAHVRLGAEQVHTFDETDVVAGAQLRAEDVLIVVAYDSASHEIHVYRAASNGLNPVHIGKWFQLDDAADEPPRVFMAEVAGKMFVAHDEPVFLRRAPTIYYDPVLGMLEPLEASWAHDGGIRFRGVVEHLGVYLAGWGYGTVDEIRPDVVRMSMPGDPTDFRLKYFEPVGQRGEAVTRCVSTGATLLCWSRAQIWEHFGSDRSTFGARPIDTNFGLEGSRLAVGIDGAVYFWSRSGPRRTAGGLSEDLAVPLELGAPSPDDLVAEGSADHAFATFYPPEHEVWFVFGKRVYAFSLRTERWRYDVLGFEPAAAILTQPGVDIDPGYEPGYADDVRVTSDELADGLRDVTVEWDNVHMSGDELLELWMHDGDEWGQVESVHVRPQAVQSQTFEALEAGHAYKWQIRGRRGTMFRDGYEGSDPDEWPNQSLLEYTTKISAPAIVSAEWERTASDSERIRLTIEPAHADVKILVYRNESLIDTLAAPGDLAPLTYDDDTANGLGGEEEHSYVIRSKVGSNESDDSDSVSQWAGPCSPGSYQAVTGQALGESYDVYFDSAPDEGTGSSYEVYDRNITEEEPVTTFAKEIDVPTGQPVQVQHPGKGGDDYETEIRHKQEAFGTGDYSPFIDRQTVTLSD